MRWDIFVSSEYLTLSLLVSNTREIRYETAIDSVFRNENADEEMVRASADYSPTISVRGHPEVRDIKDLIHAFKTGNTNYSGRGSKDILSRLVFGYGWTAERSHFYNSVAAMKECDAFLAPLRDAFCESCCRIDSRSQISSLIEQLKVNSQETLAHILEPSGNAKFAMRLPFFTAYFITKAEDPRECIELALSARNSAELRDCRVIFYNMAHLSTEARYKEANSILKYIKQSCDGLMKKYAVATENGLQFSVSLGLTGVSISAGLKVSQLFRTYKNRPFSRVFRNIAQDMLNVERLGGLYEKVCSSVKPHDKATYPKIPVTPKFMEKRENEHGRPADI